jgi:hypothetical protein
MIKHMIKGDREDCIWVLEQFDVEGLKLLVVRPVSWWRHPLLKAFISDDRRVFGVLYRMLDELDALVEFILCFNAQSSQAVKIGFDPKWVADMGSIMLPGTEDADPYKLMEKLPYVKADWALYLNAPNNGLILLEDDELHKVASHFVGQWRVMAQLVVFHLGELHYSSDLPPFIEEENFIVTLLPQ